MSETCREMTLLEELEQLNIPDDIKRRLLDKAERLKTTTDNRYQEICEANRECIRLAAKARAYRNALIEIVREDDEQIY